jgi:peptidoglycan hydrolase-like protein with peptidoglycan-binding domain
MRGRWRNTVVLVGLAGSLLAGMAAATAAELTTDEVAEMEQLLLALNFDPGPIDGAVDARTRTAIRLYQEFSALPVDGEPSAKLLGELRQVTQALAEMRQTTTPAEPKVAEDAAPTTPEPAEPVVTEVPPPAPAETPEQVADQAAEPAAVASEPSAAEAAEPAIAEAPAPAVAETAEPPAPAVAEPAKPETAEPEAAAVPEPKIMERKAAEPAAPKAVEEFNLAGMIARLKQQRGDTPPAAPAAADDPAGRERTLIWRVQQELQRIGLDPGTADGNLRPHTTRAIETYQRARGVPADGRVSAELLARLEAEATPSGPTPGDAAAPAAPGPAVAAVNTAPGNGYAAFKAGFGAAQAGDFETAVKLYSQAIASGDLPLEHLATVLYDRANAYHYLGAADQAIDDYSAAIAYKPSFPAAYYNRGFAYDLKGEQTLAVDDFRKARDLGLQRLGVRAPNLPPPL